jgi:Zn-dependent protease with chaperone function
MEYTASRKAILSGLPPTAFQHPLDRQATEQLKRIRGFDVAVAKFLEYGVERLQYVFNVANSVRVGPKQLPALYAMLREGCAVLDIAEPELYVKQGHLVNAFTMGHNHPFVVIEGTLLDVMNELEIMSVIAHELGHIKCGHVLYKQMAGAMTFMGQVIGDMTLGMGRLLLSPIEAGLTLWDRRSELSADRASLLVMQDPEPCLSSLMKLAGGSRYIGAELDLGAFLQQAHSYREELDNKMSDQFYRLVASLYKGTHPFAVERARALLDWLDTTEPEAILHGDYSRVERTPASRPCSACGQATLPEQTFCGKCSHPLRAW